MVTWPDRPWRMAGPLPYLAVPLARKGVGHPTPDAFAGRGQLSNFLSLSTQQLMGSSREHSYPTADELALWLRMTSGRSAEERLVAAERIVNGHLKVRGFGQLKVR